jgi:hypothetical protein
MSIDRTKIDRTKNEAPAEACRLAGGEVTFAAAAAEPGKTVPIKMLARSAQPIENPWWGLIVHDMAGMKLHKERLPVDYEHWQPIGYLDKFDASDKGLFVEGALVPTGQPGDRTAELVALAAGGVPYEASIYFGGDGIKVEFLGEGQVADVNGYQLEGPATIVREWPLRGVAVCPYGADMNTESAFKRSNADPVKFTALTEDPMKKNLTKSDADKGTALSDAQQTEAPASAPATDGAAPESASENSGDAPAADDPAPSDQPADALQAGRDEAKKFQEKFGAQGPVWFAEGLTFEQANERHVKELQADNEKLRKELAGKNGTRPTGEQTPAAFSAAGQSTPAGLAGKIRFAGHSAR